MRPVSVFLRADTWARDSHGLFDYESTHLSSACYECGVAGSLARAGEKVSFHTETEEVALDAEPLLRLSRTGEFQFSVSPASDIDDLWLVIRYLTGPRKGVLLRRDAVLKLGRVRYRVKDVRATESEGSLSCTDTTGSDEDCEAASEDTCRVCYDRQMTEENPLLSHCKCDGSVKFVHYLCLKQWIRSKVAVRTSDSSMTYQWKPLECEICKTELPLSIRAKGVVFNLLDFEKPQVPFIVLEAVGSERSTSKTMHVISLSSKPSVRLGRGHDSDVRINDISVSRCHAQIKFEGGLFLLEDNNSKFGSLLKIDDVLEITEEVTVQAGRSLVKLQPRASDLIPSPGFRELPVPEPQ